MRRRHRETADERGYGARERKPKPERRVSVFLWLFLGWLVTVGGLVYWLVTR